MTAKYCSGYAECQFQSKGNFAPPTLHQLLVSMRSVKASPAVDKDTPEGSTASTT